MPVKCCVLLTDFTEELTDLLTGKINVNPYYSRIDRKDFTISQAIIIIIIIIIYIINNLRGSCGHQNRLTIR